MTAVSIPDVETEQAPAASTAQRKHLSCSALDLGISLAVVTTVALLFRIPFLTGRSIWYDEASAWQTASFSPSGIIESLQRNVHMPLYYFVLKAWVLLCGDSVLAMRGLSVMFGTLAALGMYFVALECSRCIAVSQRNARSGVLPLLAALFMATNAFQINAGIEVRMYAMGTMLAIFSGLALLKLLAAPANWGWWFAWMVLCVALTYTHHHCLFLVAAQFSFLFGLVLFAAPMGKASRSLVVKRGVLAALFVMCAYIPGVLLLLGQISRVQQDYWTQPMSVVLVTQTFMEFVSPLLRQEASRNAVGLASLGVVCLATGTLIHRMKTADAFALTLGIMPLLAAAIVTVSITPVWEGRFFRFSQPFLLLGLALAITRLFRPIKLQIIAGAVLLGVFTFTSFDFWSKRQIPNRPGMRGAIARIFEEGPSDRLIVSTSNIHLFPAKYYVGNQAAVRILQSGTREFWGDHLIRDADIASDDELQKNLEDGIWVLSHSPIPAGAIELRGLIIDKYFVVPYDDGVPDWKIHVSFVHRLDVDRAQLVAQARKVD